MFNPVQHPETGKPVPPAFGIGYGQRGFWGNEHFATQAQAEAAFQAHLAEVASGGSWMGQRVEVIEEAPVGNLLRRVRVVGLLKSGKRGKIAHTIHLYRLEN